MWASALPSTEKGNARSLQQKDGNRYRFLRFLFKLINRQRGEDRGLDINYMSISLRRVAYAGNFDANNAPITYTVKDGQRIKCLTDYIQSSKFSELSLNISFMYRF